MLLYLTFMISHDITQGLQPRPVIITDILLPIITQFYTICCQTDHSFINSRDKNEAVGIEDNR